MDLKRSLTKPKADKKINPKRSDSQVSLPCLTEPNQPCKESSRYPELPNRHTERTSFDPIKLQRSIKEKEACALDYLRRLSDEESSYEIERKMTNLDDELDPLDDSDRLSPFMNSTKRYSNQQTQNSTFVPTNTQTKFVKKVKKVRRKNEEVVRKEAPKRIQSEPNEKTSTKNVKNQSCQFIFYELPQKATVNKVNIGTDLIEEPTHFRRSSSIYEKFNVNAMTEPDYYDITAPTNEPKLKEKDIVVNGENSKAPPVLQVRRLVGQNYSRILQEMREYRDTGALRDMKSLLKGKRGRQDVESNSSRKAYYSKEKKYPGVPSSFRHGPSNIVLVGRSVSVPKFPVEFENYVDNDFNTKKLSIEDTRERRKTSLSDHGDSKDMPYKDELLKGIRSISSAGTSRKNFRGDSDFDTRPFSKDKEMNNIFYEDQSRKEDDPIFITKPTNESFNDLAEDKVRAVEDSKGIQELKIGFWFKAKKNMLNPPSPKREALVQEKPPSFGLNHRRKRETCKENKVLLDKVSEVYKFKMGVINPQQSKRQTDKNPLGIAKPPLNVKDLNLYKRDPRQANLLNKQNSFREAYSIDIKGLDGKAPKLKAILNVLNKELKSERSFSPNRKSSNNSIKNIHSARKGLDGLADFLNMKGSQMKLKISRFDEN